MLNLRSYLHGLKLLGLIIAYRLDRLLLPKYLAPSTWLMPCCFSASRRNILQQGRGAQLTAILERMGPIFIKFGQVLSMRHDIFPKDIIMALSRLQDQVLPFPGEVAEQQIAKVLGQSIDVLFKSFERQPLASASIAQVHAAVLNEGDAVVVKILRPGIRNAVANDIRLLYRLARWASWCIKDSARLRLTEVVAELERHLQDELDLTREAANASVFKRDFPDETPLKVPTVYWPYVRKEVMVIERIYGVPILKIEQLRHHQVDLQYLAETGLQLFFKQVFENNFFHADMHGGNVFVNIDNPSKPSYICVDFGIMGALSNQDKYYIAENLVAFFNRDYRRIAMLHIASKWVPNSVRVDQFESAIRAVSEPIFALPLSQISFGRLLVSLFKTAHQFEVEIQPQLILLQKTLLNVEALGRLLYPELDLWKTAKPYLENWVKSQVGWKTFSHKVVTQWPHWMAQFPELPELCLSVIQQLPNLMQQPVSSPRAPIALSPRQTLCVGLLLGVAMAYGALLLGWL